jgi:hypothetical protein
MDRPDRECDAGLLLRQLIVFHELQRAGRAGLDAARTFRAVATERALLCHVPYQAGLDNSERAGQRAGTAPNTVEIRLEHNPGFGIPDNHLERAGRGAQGLLTVPAPLRQQGVTGDFTVPDPCFDFEPAPAGGFAGTAANAVVRPEYDAFHVQTDGFSLLASATRSVFSSATWTGATVVSPVNWSSDNGNRQRFE